VLGIRVAATPATLIQDARTDPANRTPLAFTDLAVGDYVRFGYDLQNRPHIERTVDRHKALLMDQAISAIPASGALSGTAVPVQITTDTKIYHIGFTYNDHPLWSCGDQASDPCTWSEFLPGVPILETNDVTGYFEGSYENGVLVATVAYFDAW
jgi:hypothetical protein